MTRFALRPSRYLTLAFAASHVTAAALVIPLQIPLTMKLLLWTLIVASLAYALLRHALLRTGNAIANVSLQDGATAFVTLRNGTALETQILETSYVTPALTVLNLRVANERLARHVLFVPDNINQEDYRRLRVILKWARASARVRQSAGADQQAAP